MIDVVVTRVTHEAQDVRSIELRSVDGSELPPFSAGSHIDLHLPGGLCRQYSLLNDPRERHRYVLGVGLAAASRGGSKFVHHQLSVGDRFAVGAPRSLFGIEESAAEHVFIAGGIGITPILSMIQWCEAQDKPWKLLYCVRSRSRAAFLWTLARRHDRVELHVDEEQDGAHADLRGFIGTARPGANVYCCGPSPLMDAVAHAAVDAGVPKAATHFERFTADSSRSDTEAGVDKPFTVVLNRSGNRIVVEPGVSILEALEDNGVPVPFSCREGLCRSCEMPLLCGEADHRDFVLSDEERAANRSILICVSRACSEELVLDA